jgi:MSHA biogenesis protein MshM
MYRDFFKLREHPFSLTPDTDFWFDAAGHRDAMNVLCAMLRLGEGFIKVSAEIGLGKTLLCRQLLKELDKQFLTAYVPDPQLSPYGLICAVADEVGGGSTEQYAKDRLMTFIRNRLLALTFETLRLLTNLETEKFKLLQVVIVGQPELDSRLKQPSMRQLNQRISFSCTLSPMSFAATAGYIYHRIRVADCRSKLRFTDRAIRQICKASGGIPRVINVLCHKSLMVAYGRGDFRITTEHVERAIEDTDIIGRSGSWRNPFATMRGMLFPPPRISADLGVLHGVER